MKKCFGTVILLSLILNCGEKTPEVPDFSNEQTGQNSSFLWQGNWEGVHSELHNGQKLAPTKVLLIFNPDYQFRLELISSKDAFAQGSYFENSSQIIFEAKTSTIDLLPPGQLVAFEYRRRGNRLSLVAEDQEFEFRKKTEEKPSPKDNSLSLKCYEQFLWDVNIAENLGVQIKVSDHLGTSEPLILRSKAKKQKGGYLIPLKLSEGELELALTKSESDESYLAILFDKNPKKEELRRFFCQPL